MKIRSCYSFICKLTYAQINALIDIPADLDLSFPSCPNVSSELECRLIYDEKWIVTVGTLLKLEESASVDVKVIVYRSILNSNIPDWLDIKFTKESFDDYTLNLPKIEYKKYNVLSDYTISEPKNIVRDNKVVLQTDWSTYKNFETEDFIDHFIWCNLPYSEYKKPMGFDEMSYDYSNNEILQSNCVSKNMNWYSFVYDVAYNGIQSILNFEVDTCGSIAYSYECSHRLFAARYLKLPYIPSCLMFRQFKDSNLFKYQLTNTHPKSEYLCEVLNKYLSPNIVF